MIASSVLSEDSLKAALAARDCVQTEHKTQTGTFWKTRQGLHFLVPRSLDGFYADWMLWDLERVIGKIEAQSAFNRKQ